jgi:hypothetical protein
LFGGFRVVAVNTAKLDRGHYFLPGGFGLPDRGQKGRPPVLAASARPFR